MKRTMIATSIQLGLSVMLAGIVQAAEIKVITTGSFKEALGELAPAFERSSGHKVVPILAGTDDTIRRLSAGERTTLLARARVREYSAHDTIFLMDSPGDSMVAVLSGTIRISVPSAGGKELLLAVIQPGEVFGELAVLDGKERSADAVAETACTVAILDRREILSFFERNPSAWPSLVKVLCQRLRHTNQVFAEVALLELPVRLAKAMLRVLNWEADSAAAEPAKIRFSQRELANMLGGSRESVNKCLRNWQRTGVVRISGGSIIISDRRALENIAEAA